MSSVAKNEEGVTLILAQFALILTQPASKGGTRQLVAGPLRLPADEMLTAQRAQLRPRRIVRHGRMTQIDVGAADFGFRIDAR